jgi:cysteine sulfinate desulfinase/cysteine desulfurase-like protein
VHINGDVPQRLPHSLTIGFQFVEGDRLLMGIQGMRQRGYQPPQANRRF